MSKKENNYYKQTVAETKYYKEPVAELLIHRDTPPAALAKLGRIQEQLDKINERFAVIVEVTDEKEE